MDHRCSSHVLYSMSLIVFASRAISMIILVIFRIGNRRVKTNQPFLSLVSKVDSTIIEFGDVH